MNLLTKKTSNSDDQSDHQTDHQSDHQTDDTEDDINGWNVEKEEFLKKIANRNAALVWMHNHASNRYIIINKVWSFIVAVMIIIFSGAGIPATVGNNIDALGLSMQILTIVAGIVTIAQTIIDLDSIASNHTDAATQCSDLWMFILKELRETKYELRIPGDRFVHMIVEKDSYIKNGTPDIPRAQIRKYYKAFQAKAIPYDDLFGAELMNINESLQLFKSREHDKSIVQNIMNVSRKMSNDDGSTLEEKLKEHKTKYVHKVPALTKEQLANLENYILNDE